MTCKSQNYLAVKLQRYLACDKLNGPFSAGCAVGGIVVFGMVSPGPFKLLDQPIPDAWSAVLSSNPLLVAQDAWSLSLASQRKWS